MNELKRRERWAELAASIAQADHNTEHKARRRDRLHWWRRHPFLTPWFCAAVEPVAAALTSEATAFVSEVGPGEAGSETTVTHTTAGFVGPAGPTTPTVRPVRGEGPATPHLEATLASRISARTQ